MDELRPQYSSKIWQGESQESKESKESQESQENSININLDNDIFKILNINVDSNVDIKLSIRDMLMVMAKIYDKNLTNDDVSLIMNNDDIMNFKGFVFSVSSEKISYNSIDDELINKIKNLITNNNKSLIDKLASLIKNKFL